MWLCFGCDDIISTPGIEDRVAYQKLWRGDDSIIGGQYEHWEILWTSGHVGHVVALGVGMHAQSNIFPDANQELESSLRPFMLSFSGHQFTP